MSASVAAVKAVRCAAAPKVNNTGRPLCRDGEGATSECENTKREKIINK